MSARRNILFAAAALFVTGAAAAGDIAAGEAKAAPCAACHGAGGNEPIGDFAKLAGQDRKYLLYTLRAYKSGARDGAALATQMTAQMADMTDQDLQDLAAYFAAQPGDLR